MGFCTQNKVKMRREYLNLFALILVLTVIATSLFVWKVFLSNRQKTAPAPPTKIVEPTPTSGFQKEVIQEEGVGESPEEIIQSLRKKFPLYDWAPYTSENFSVRYVDKFQLEVSLKENTPEARQEVLDWIRSKGVDPETHEIDWEIKP